MSLGRFNRALSGLEARALSPWKSNGALVKFCLRAQWTPQNWRIGDVFQWRDPSNFAWGPWKFKWLGPRTLNKKCLLRALFNWITTSYGSFWVWAEPMRGGVTNYVTPLLIGPYPEWSLHHVLDLAAGGWWEDPDIMWQLDGVPSDEPFHLPRNPPRMYPVRWRNSHAKDVLRYGREREVKRLEERHSCQWQVYKVWIFRYWKPGIHFTTVLTHWGRDKMADFSQMTFSKRNHEIIWI